MRKKIFVIGLPNSGLTSVLLACHKLGLKVHGTNEVALNAYFKDDLVTIYDYFGRYDVIAGWPVPLMYKLAFRHYGRRAIYILTLHRNADAWVESLKKTSMTAHPLNTWFPKTFGYRWPHGFENQFRAFYDSYNEEAVRFFSENNASSQLETFFPEKKGTWKKLYEFIGFEAPVKNVLPISDDCTTQTPEKYIEYYNRIGSSIYRTIAPKLIGRHPISLP